MPIIIQWTHTEVVLEDEVGLEQAQLILLKVRIVLLLLGGFQLESPVFQAEDRNMECGSSVPQKHLDLLLPNSADYVSVLDTKCLLFYRMSQKNDCYEAWMDLMCTQAVICEVRLGLVSMGPSQFST